MTRRALSVLCLALALSLPTLSRGHAEPTALTTSTLEATQSIAKIKRDASGKPAYLARFSDGPRRVPRPRGTAQARAQRLGLGTHGAAIQFFRARPPAQLLAEVQGESPRTLLWPVVGGRWGRGFGYTRRVRPELRHNGIDIGAKEGAVVRAAADGLVVYSDNGLLGYGNCVMILHGNGWLTLYAHNLRTTVQPGWRVKRGERIGLVGKTGYAWGPHLHFELRDNARLRDPKPLLTGYRSDEVNGPLVELEADEPLASDAEDAHAEHAHEHERERAESKAREPVALDTSKAPSPPSAAAVALPTAARLLRAAPTDEEKALAGERVFRNLLWPVKGGTLRKGYEPKHPALVFAAAAGAGVRVAADGVVIHAGTGLANYDNVVVVLHANGWVTSYDGAHEIAVKPGDRVLRGEWIARVGDQAEAPEQAELRFEWRDGGKRRDPASMLIGAPQEL